MVIERRWSVNVKVQYFAAVRELLGLREETLELPDRSTVSVLLDELDRRHGGRLRVYLYDAKTGKLRSSVHFLIGDMPIPATEVSSTILPDGAVFAIIPPVGGG
jgi:molybdopterin converting factor small subunit